MTDPDKPGRSTQSGRADASGKAVEPSGPKGDNPATAGPGNTQVVSETPENRQGQINPSAPADSTTSADTASGKNKS